MNWGKFLFSFQGRISRKAFWLYILASIVLGVLLNFHAEADAVQRTHLHLFTR